jgi:hypothetical protein
MLRVTSKNLIFLFNLFLTDLFKVIFVYGSDSIFVNYSKIKFAKLTRNSVFVIRRSGNLILIFFVFEVKFIFFENIYILNRENRSAVLICKHILSVKFK